MAVRSVIVDRASRLLGVIAALGLAGPMWAAGPVRAAEPAPELDAPGGVASTHVLVKVRPGVTLGQTRGGQFGFALDGIAVDQQLSATMQQIGVLAIEPTFSVQPADAATAARLGLDRHHRLVVPAGSDTPAIVQQLAGFSDHFEVVEVDGVGGTAALTPDDPDFTEQYGMDNTSQAIPNGGGVAGTLDADIDAPEAWDITTGSNSVRIAVLDAGLDNHVELTGRTVPGWNTVSNNDNTADTCGSHGTHVAGIAAATGNNGIGIAGMDWNAEVMPVRVLNGCTGVESTVASGLVWAADNGAHIANMSLQYGSGTAALLDGVRYARAAGVIIVAASGNAGYSGGVAFPGRWRETIAVAATNQHDLRWSSGSGNPPGSNSGPEVVVAAPGEQVYSLNNSSGYNFRDGTSMATPHVSGLVSLLLSIDPTLDTCDIKRILIGSADDLLAAGFDEDTGWGRINAHQALLDLQAGAPVEGDADGDGVVDSVDLLQLLADWGQCTSVPAICQGDVNCDETVDVTDLLALIANWTTTP